MWSIQIQTIASYNTFKPSIDYKKYQYVNFAKQKIYKNKKTIFCCISGKFLQIIKYQKYIVQFIN